MVLIISKGRGSTKSSYRTEKLKPSERLESLAERNRQVGVDREMERQTEQQVNEIIKEAQKEE